MAIIKITREIKCSDCKNLQLKYYKGKLKRYECILNHPIPKGMRTKAIKCNDFIWEFSE